LGCCICRNAARSTSDAKVVVWSDEGEMFPKPC
jgi:hypothetical protein